MANQIIPTQIQPIGNELAIAWSDGSESYLGFEVLRRACPCAACGGEPDVLGQVIRPEVHYTPESFILRGCQIVGSYAVQPMWADGHGSGLYLFSVLRRLGGAENLGVA